VRPYGEVFQSKDVKSLTTGMHVEETFAIPQKFTEKSDIEVRAISSSNSVSFDISAAFEIVYKRGLDKWLVKKKTQYAKPLARAVIIAKQKLVQA
jgi:hypothetical protein